MRYVPPYTTLCKWMDSCVTAGRGHLTFSYDDILDVFRGFLLVVPVDEDWYKAEYPAILEFLVQMPTETAASHFRKHGYFEGRKPFPPSSQDRTAPVPFDELQNRLRIIPALGRLTIEIARDDLVKLIKALLRAVPVDAEWYRANYPDVAKTIDSGMLASAADHYVEWGYFEGRIPFDIAVDSDWYMIRYDYVRTELERGVVGSAQDHFIRVGYKQGCRPTPP
jgi:hypothetical protein